MAEYKGIKGFKVQTVSTDPAANQYAGGTWSSGGSLNTSRYGNAGAGTLTSGLSIDGFNPSVNALVEEYNGTSWSEIAENNTARAFGVGAGANAEAALFFSGNVPPSLSAANESYNGTAWTEIADLATARRNACGAGTQTAAICIGGANNNPPDTNRLDVVEVWNGTSWTEVAEVNTAGGDAASAGTSTDSIKAGTSNGPGLTVELWNGTSWTETTELNTGRYYLRGSGPSGLTDTLVFGGQNPPGAQAVTEKWDGSTWTELSDMASARGAMASTNTTSSEAWAAGGTSDGGSTYVTTTEEWSAPALFSKSNLGQVFYNSTSNAFKVTKSNSGVSLGTWASGGNTNTEAGQRGGASRSSTTNAFVSGGFIAGGPSVTTNAESYNGTAWTEGPNQPATNRIGAAWGTTISYVTAGGSTGITGAPINPYAFEWNGTSFSNGGTMNNARRNAAGAGVSETAGRAMAGGDNPGPAQSFNESYDGTSFTEETDCNTARVRPIGFGTTTEAIIASGGGGTNVEQWNGSSWTEIAEVLTATSNSAGGAGTTTDGLIFTMASPGAFATTQFWNGSSWSEVAELAVNRYANTGGGAGSTNAISVGGYGPPATVATSTEEWSAPAPFASNVTLTAS